MKEFTQEQRDFLDESVKGKWSINTDTGLVDVEGNVWVRYYIKSGRLPVSLGKVIGDFNVVNNILTTLEGCPHWVGGNFYCDNNNLTSLKFAPKYVGGGAEVWGNPLQMLDWLPEHISGELKLVLSYIETEFYGIIIPEIEALLDKGIKLRKPEKYYYQYRDAHYENKLIELM